ncbi:7-cyano-7-deazaguanine synthase [Mesorhizobium sp. M1066]|uniref:7-cyano-7-deazaguanine synthase n=1 Tax=unclassified Mesorhizobium TaxID=325217 RepID=UPI00333D0C20
MTDANAHELPSLQVHVVEVGASARRDWLKCQLGTHLNFNTHALASYFFVAWEPMVYDALLLAAAIEFCDRTLRRSKRLWGRSFRLHLPVHEPDKWNDAVLASLHDAVELLTGDRWDITVYRRKSEAPPPPQSQLFLPTNVQAVMPFSDGLDSRAVSALMDKELGDQIVRVRLGSKTADQPKTESGRNAPFTAVPYKIVSASRFAESTARSRGFKFGMLSGIAAYLAKAPQVIVPESGQGALGPVLVVPGQAYEDYRNHPLFTVRMSALLKALLGYDVRYEFPRLWFTKGETLSAYASADRPMEWAATRSCWQDNRHASVDDHRRQCGICAACMLRRMSIHYAGLKENDGTYIWDNLGAPEFQAAAATGYRQASSKAQREYAIAGTLHLEHLSSLRQSRLAEQTLGLATFQLAQALGISENTVRENLDRLLSQHEKEWTDYMTSLGPNSFVAGFAGRGQ